MPRWNMNAVADGAELSFHPLASSTPARRPRRDVLDYDDLYLDPSFDFDTLAQAIPSEDDYEPEDSGKEQASTDSSDDHSSLIFTNLAPGIYLFISR